MGQGYERIIEGRSDPWHDKDWPRPYIEVGMEGERMKG